MVRVDLEQLVNCVSLRSKPPDALLSR